MRSLVWNTSDGLWSASGNWTDVTGAAHAALTPPDASDLATVTAAGPAFGLSGPGAAAQLTVFGSVALGGTYDIGVAVFRPYNWAVDSAPSLAGVMQAGTVAVASLLTVSGEGSRLMVAGTLALATDGPPGGPTTIGQIILADHAVVQADQLDLSGHFGLSTILIGGVAIDATSALEVGTTGGAAPGALTVDAGRSVVVGADIQADVVNNGSMVMTGFAYHVPRVSGAVSGNGSIALVSTMFDFGGGADFAGPVAAGQVIVFSGPNQILRLEAPESFAGTILGFNRNNTIALPAAITAASFTPSGGGGVLALFAGGSPAGSLVLAGVDFLAASFRIDAGSGGAVLSTDAAPCFAAGTRVATLGGEMAVEALRPGDAVLTVEGRVMRVRWVGHRRVACRHHPRPWDVQPVRIGAGAFGPGRPARPLFLSPDHAVACDGVLVPVRYLLNGATVVQGDVEAVTYWHVELERHALLLAEGLACESYLDTGNRGAFANGGAVVALHPDFGRGAWDRLACAPLVTGGAALARVRAGLLARAAVLGHARTAEPELALEVAGRCIAPRRAGSWHMFRLPAWAGPAVLRSRSVVPAELHAAHADHRRLGVAVARMRLDGAALALDDRRLGRGWHPPEAGLRWTDGAAAIDLSGTRLLAVAAPPLLDYWAEPAVRPAGRSGYRHSRP